MRKYIYIVFSLVMLMGLGACSDDFSWNGIEVGEDEYLISFAVSDPDIVVLGGTRAETVEPVDHITLVIFDGDDMVQDPITVYSSDTENFVAQTTLNGNGSIKLKRNEVQDGDWYLIANAHTQISNIFKQVTRNDGRLSKPEFLKAMSYDNNQFSVTNKVMVGHLKDVELTSGKQTIGNIVKLQRTYCQISVEVEDDGIPFRLCSARLSRISDTGDLTLSGDNKTLTDDDFTDPDKWVPVPADRSLSFTNNGNTVYYASTGAQIKQYSFPYTPEDNASNQEKIMMLVRGYFSKDDFDGVDECFYAIPLPEIEANHYYQIKIIGASESGATTAELAENNPNGIIVTFEDMTDKIKNIMTDGTNVLAVQDTVVIATDGKPVNIPIKVRTTGESQPTITLTKKNTSANSAWLHGVDVITTLTGENISSAEESKNKLYNCLITGSVSADENKGSERAVTYTIKLEGTALTRDIVFLQEGNKEIKYVSSSDSSCPIESLKLVIKRNGSVVQSIDNYLGYINPDVVDGAPATQCAGIKPAQNGGRERNIGLHAPMPNGGAVYEYTFKLRSGATITGNKLTYTFSDSDVPEGGTDKYSYVVTSDYITITYNNVTYTLDLYHTGFFHNNLYYEVFTQEDGEDGLYWLDRNLGATSSGVGVRTTDGVISGTSWPYVGADAIGDYCGSSPSCPPGWGVPSYAQLRSLTTRAAFGISRRYINGTAYFAPAFQFDAIVDGQPQKISSYFPLGLKKTGSTYDGTEGAGYYLTTTSSGTSGYFKTMQFTGMNIVAQNTNFDNSNAPKYTMSVRCCAGTYNPATDGTVYKCSVYGYTNVFMYYLNADGSKTPLTTWPGERIAMQGDLGRYHPFEITPTMNYDMSRLYVIFNVVTDDGDVYDSNVNKNDRNNRIGIKFVNNGKYSSENTAGTERPEQKGNWTNNTDYDSEEFRITGKFNTISWPTTVSSTYSFTSKGNGLYEAKVVVTTPGPFIIAQKDAGWTKNNYKEWKHDVKTTTGTKIENNKTYTMYSGKGDNYDWRFDTAGTYTLTLNWKTKTFSVSIDDSGETTTVEKFRLKGNFNNLYQNGNWGNGYDAVSLGDNKYRITVDVTTTGQFVILQQKANASGWSDSEVTQWKCAVEKTGGTALTDGTYTMTTNDGYDYNWLFDRTGTYTIEIDWSSSTKKFTVTCPELSSSHINGEVLSNFKAGENYYISFNGSYKLWLWIEDSNPKDEISKDNDEDWNNKTTYSGGISFTLKNDHSADKELKININDTNGNNLAEKSYSRTLFKWSSANNRWEANLGDLVPQKIGIWWYKSNISSNAILFYTNDGSLSPFWPGTNWNRKSATELNNNSVCLIVLETEEDIAAFNKLSTQANAGMSFGSGMEVTWSGHHWEEGPSDVDLSSYNLSKCYKVWKD